MSKNEKESIPEETKKEQENKSAKQNLPKYLILFFCFVIIIVIVICYVRTNDRLWQERANGLKLITQQASAKIEIICNNQWEKVEAAENRLANLSTHTDSTFIAEILELEEEIYKQNIRFLLYTDQGVCYDSTGTSMMWQDMDDLSSDQERQIKIYNLHGFWDNAYQMVYLYKLPHALQSDNYQYTHIALVQNMSDVEDSFASAIFGDAANTFIINANGSWVYHQNNDKAFITSYNILQAVKGDRFLHGTSFNQLHTDLLSGRAGCVHFRHQGTEFLMSYYPMQTDNDWSVLLLVPAEQVGANTIVFLHYILLNMALVSVLFILLTVLVLLLNKRKILLQSEKSKNLLRKAAQKEREASMAKSQFISRMSHDIRTPINGIFGMVHIAKANLDDQATLKKCLDEIEESSDHLFSLVNDVLDMSRIENGKIEIKQEPINLFTILNSSILLMDSEVRERGLSLVCQYDLPYPKLIGDALHLRQILLNILSNAVKFTEPGGAIRLRAKETACDDNTVSLRIEIEDTGIGMSKDFLLHIFEPFTQEDSRSSKSLHGTGLGMSIVKQLVELMGGTISVSSKPGEGSLFTVDFCLSIDQQQNKDIAENPGEEVDLSALHILLVEDNALNMEIATFIFEELGVMVSPARDGLEAVKLFESCSPGTFDAIFMDIMMPVMDGFEATKLIRSLNRADAASIPIIAMTANAFTDDIERTKDSGMNGHLAKPVSKKDFKECLVNLCRNR